MEVVELFYMFDAYISQPNFVELKTHFILIYKYGFCEDIIYNEIYIMIIL